MVVLVIAVAELNIVVGLLAGTVACFLHDFSFGKICINRVKNVECVLSQIFNFGVIGDEINDVDSKLFAIANLGNRIPVVFTAKRTSVAGLIL